MGVKDWFRKQMVAIVFATSNVEKDMLNQKSVEIGTGFGMTQRLNQGTLMDALTRGEITQEVIDLRWRMFKVLNASDGLIITGKKIDENGNNVFEFEKAHNPSILKNVKLDEHDDYPLEFMVMNDDVTIGSMDATDTSSLKIKDSNEIEDSIKVDEEHNMKTKTLATISSEDYHSSMKTVKPIIINREFRPKFEIEKYAKKMNVRKINEAERLLEFYISLYPDMYDKKTKLLKSEIERAIKNPRVSDLLDISDVGFMAYKTPGAKDFHQYQYKITNFDKIIKYDGYYVIKFKSEVTVNGEYLLEKYRSEELDERYENKEAKN